ncbi:MAG TPA: PHP domain-containing protein [Nannocystaceae bacterium]|nr:PHP domain-containing protein [Nannocystaceae bacterium]
MRIELHCHSTHSDGSFPPGEVAAWAARTGVRLFCLTDHDTDGGWAATRDVLADAPCIALRGLELSCREFDRTVHVLLLGLRDGPGLTALHARLERVHTERSERLRAICERLARLGIALDPEAILARSHGRTPGRPDVARALVAAGHCSSFPDAFTRYLRDGGPADVPLAKLSVAEGVALGCAAGAKASLAHPYTLGSHALVDELFARHRAIGLEGIEACYGVQGPAETAQWLPLAQSLDLVVTAGSDFHGELNPLVTQPGRDLPEAHVDRLFGWLELERPRD